jgi:hypothetical protein
MPPPPGIKAEGGSDKPKRSHKKRKPAEVNPGAAVAGGMLPFPVVAPPMVGAVGYAPYAPPVAAPVIPVMMPPAMPMMAAPPVPVVVGQPLPGPQPPQAEAPAPAPEPSYTDVMSI